MDLASYLKKLIPTNQVNAIINTVKQNITGNLPTAQQAISNVKAVVTKPQPQTYTITPSIASLKVPNMVANEKVTQPTQSFAQIGQTQQKTGGGAIIASAAPAKTQSVGQVKGAFAASDINPQTGLPYAINPTTGQWDDGWYQYLVRLMSEKNVPLTTIQQLGKYGQSNISYTKIEEEEFEKAKPYYERLLKEANWDINQAVGKLKEEYDLGLRTTRESKDIERTSLVKQEAPREYTSMMDELARRGLLQTVTGEAKPLETQLSTGEKIKVETPQLTKSYGGLASRRIGSLLASQEARAEAINKAQKAREEELNIPYKYGSAAYEEERKRKAAELEQSQRKEAVAAAGVRYGRESQIAQSKYESLLNPYL